MALKAAFRDCFRAAGKRLGVDALAGRFGAFLTLWFFAFLTLSFFAFVALWFFAFVALCFFASALWFVAFVALRLLPFVTAHFADFLAVCFAPFLGIVFGRLAVKRSAAPRAVNRTSLRDRVIEGATTGARALESVVPAIHTVVVVRVVRAESRADRAAFDDG